MFFPPYLSVRSFFRPSVLGFNSLAYIVFDGFYSNFAYTLILEVSDLGLLMGKIR